MLSAGHLIFLVHFLSDSGIDTYPVFGAILLRLIFSLLLAPKLEGIKGLSIKSCSRLTQANSHAPTVLWGAYGWAWVTFVHLLIRPVLSEL